MGKMIDRTGTKINDWTFLEFRGMTKEYNARWLCRCKCGNEYVVLGYNVMNGSSKKCLKCRDINHIRSYENCIPNPVWTTVISNAKKKNRKIHFDQKYAYNLFLKQDKKCAISGIDIRFACNNKDYELGNQNASLDRIDSSKSYVKGNVQWVHKDINIMKNIFTMEKFLNYCKLIHLNNN